MAGNKFEELLRDKLIYNVGSKPKDLAPVEYSAGDKRLIEKRVAKLSGQRPNSFQENKE